MDIDKLVKEYPGLSPYQYASLNPILNTDLNGLEGYDAKTGEWVPVGRTNTRFAVSPKTYELVKNWYATNGGINNPTNLQVQAPKENYTYVYTPPNDPGHPDVHGYNSYGPGYWYAEKKAPSITAEDDNEPPSTGRLINVTIGAGNETSGSATKYIQGQVEEMIDHNQTANNQTSKDVTRAVVAVGQENFQNMKPEDINHLRQDLQKEYPNAKVYVIPQGGNSTTGAWSSYEGTKPTPSNSQGNSPSNNTTPTNNTTPSGSKTPSSNTPTPNSDNNTNGNTAPTNNTTSGSGG